MSEVIVEEFSPEDLTSCEVVEPDEPESIIVGARDTWGTLVEKFGSDIATRNGFTFATSLRAGMILH